MVFSVQLRKRARRSLEVECLAADATNPGDIVSGLKNVVFRSGPKMRVVLSRHGQKMELERERQKSRSNPGCAIERIFDSNPGFGQIIARVIQYPCQIHRGLGALCCQCQMNQRRPHASTSGLTLATPALWRWFTVDPEIVY